MGRRRKEQSVMKERRRMEQKGQEKQKAKQGKERGRNTMETETPSSSQRVHAAHTWTRQALGRVTPLQKLTTEVFLLV